MLYFSTKLQLTKIPIAPKSTSIYTNKSFDALVVSNEIGKYREVSQILRAPILEC